MVGASTASEAFASDDAADFIVDRVDVIEALLDLLPEHFEVLRAEGRLCRNSLGMRARKIGPVLEPKLSAGTNTNGLISSTPYPQPAGHVSCAVAPTALAGRP